MILIDSNVIIDIIDRDPVWFDWSFENIDRAGQSTVLAVNAVVVGEVAPRFATLEQFTMIMTGLLIQIHDLSAEAAFIAGIAFQAHRQLRKAGDMKSILADFLIGGHAQAAGATILTRDPRFYRSYFPGVPLITPSKDD
ncbi:type II toxin-antitoxin system VapC family toxin [Sphingobium sp.]|uniref:type II toxin-antitoxin system VapC family toxin n=1 Tax=Sphingobium sp. TaxID=1912891 RepID=UPI003BB6D1F6